MTSGDARFADLYDSYYQKVFAYCRRRISADLVDDVVAETFLTAWRRIDDVPDGVEALPWLYAVAYRAIGHHYRSFGRNKKLKAKLASVGIAPVALSEELAVMDHESRQVLRALSKLRTSDQELLRLAVWEELSMSEVAEVLGISEAAAKKRSARARTALARTYERLERTGSSPVAQKGGAW